MVSFGSDVATYLLQHHSDRQEVSDSERQTESLHLNSIRVINRSSPLLSIHRVGGVSFRPI